MAEPGTRPPPSTRSSSLMPVVIRGVSASSISSRRLTTATSPAKPLRSALRVGVARSVTNSLSVFHSPHAAHWPCHLGKSAPHWVHTYATLRLAINNHPVRSCRNLAEQLVADSAAGLRHFIHGNGIAPQLDAITDHGIRNIGQVDGDHVHGDTPDHLGALPAHGNRRRVGGMTRIAIAIADRHHADAAVTLRTPA